MPDRDSHILVAIDFSPLADAVVAYTGALAGPLRAQVTLLHVVEDPAGTHDWIADLYLREVTAIRERAIEEAERGLERHCAHLAQLGVLTRRQVVIGRPTRAILAAAASLGADLVVVGTHGRTGLPHALLGSVAEQVIRAAPCPVLTVRTDARVSVRVEVSVLGSPLLAD